MAKDRFYPTKPHVNVATIPLQVDRLADLIRGVPELEFLTAQLAKEIDSDAGTAVGSPNVTVNGGPLGFVAPLLATAITDATTNWYRPRPTAPSGASAMNAAGNHEITGAVVKINAQVQQHLSDLKTLLRDHRVPWGLVVLMEVLVGSSSPSVRNDLPIAIEVLKCHLGRQQFLIDWNKSQELRSGR